MMKMPLAEQLCYMENTKELREATWETSVKISKGMSKRQLNV